MATYAEIILPLPLKGSFTYLVPDELKDKVFHGSRVYVQFGARKHYTGIVIRIHSETPNYDIKPIISVLDSDSIVKYPQLKFWHWMGEYYLCSIGEVMKAALPSGLKIESSQYVSLNKDDDIEYGALSQREMLIIDLLEAKGKMPVKDIEKELSSFKSIGFTINLLLKRGIINTAEEADVHYRPRIVTFYKFKGNPRDNEWMHKAFDLVGRSQKQEQTLIAMLDLIHKTGKDEISKANLLEKSKVSSSILKALVDKNILDVVKRKINRYYTTQHSETQISPLSALQNEVLNSILNHWKERNVVLLKGVTGSGKTEIYCHAIKEALDKGLQSLFLVPEISLTTQLTDRLRRVFGDKLLVYHSKFSDNERVDIWNKLLTTRDPLVVLGARSAIFLPFSELGVIVVDEEHDASYKQYDPAPRYNARDSAIMLATMHHAKVLLGSATPSIETFYKAQNGKYGFVELNERYEGALLPTIEIVDMKEQRKKKINDGILSSPLKITTIESLKKGKQAIMFQNRRGYAPIVVCNNCGWSPKCISCDVGLVYHKKSNHLRCHYCGYLAPLPTLCPACGHNNIGIYGFGTERIAEDIDNVFKEYKVARMDYDTTRNKNSYQEIIEDFSQKKTDILIGTQMVSKGLDFANVETVGVMNADAMLNRPDFRSAERAFNMMTQVAGRAGRREEQGKVIIQTTDPSNNILSYIKNHDYDGFYEYEIKQREQYSYPPFSRIINLYIKHKVTDVATEIARIYAEKLRAIFGNRILGPTAPPISRISTFYYQMIMIKIETMASMSKVKEILYNVYENMSQDPRMKSSQIYYDVDPA